MLLKMKDVPFNSSNNFDVKQYKSFSENFIEERKYRNGFYFLNILAFIMIGFISFYLFPFQIAVKSLFFFPILVLLQSHPNAHLFFKENYFIRSRSKRLLYYFIMFLPSSGFIFIDFYLTILYINKIKIEQPVYYIAGLFVGLIFILPFFIFVLCNKGKKDLENNFFYSETIRNFFFKISNKGTLIGIIFSISLIFIILYIAFIFYLSFDVPSNLSLGISASFFFGLGEIFLLSFLFFPLWIGPIIFFSEIIFFIIDIIISPILLEILYILKLFLPFTIKNKSYQND